MPIEVQAVAGGKEVQMWSSVGLWQLPRHPPSRSWKPWTACVVPIGSHLSRGISGSKRRRLDLDPYSLHPMTSLPASAV